MPGGMDTYLNKFEEYAQELAFHGKPLSEMQKITILLNSVKDCQYASLKTLCHSQNFNYEKTVLELHQESQELGTNDTPKHSIKTKNPLVPTLTRPNVHKTDLKSQPTIAYHQMCGKR